MKNLSRLTALLLALLMMLSSAALATETPDAIPMEDLDAETYDYLLSTAQLGWPALSFPCGPDNEYCAMVTELVGMQSAQERYDYMISLYSEDAFDVTLEAMMLHYYFFMEEHTEENVICMCDFPSLAPEYAPGALNVHEEDCPWTFDKLSKQEQFVLIGQMTEEEKAPYLETLTEEAAAGLMNSMMLVGDQLIYVRTGEAFASYDEATGVLTHIELNVPFGKVVDGAIVPLTAEPEADPAA